MTRSTDDILDELALLRFRSGDDDALNDVARRWHPRLVRHAYRLVGRSDAAADVVQDAWIAIVRGVHRLDDPVAFPAWAYRIVTNKCADWVRRQQRRRAKESSSASTRQTESVSSSHSDDGEGVDDLKLAIRALPVDQRIVVSMFYLNEQSIAEIAAALEIPPGTVKSRLHTARQYLEQILERKDNDQS